MIEFTREKVVLLNNPKCKSYDEKREYDLTLEHILIALKGEYFSNGVHIFKFNAIGLPKDFSIIKWQPSTLFENQSDETIIAIYNILSNK